MKLCILEKSIVPGLFCSLLSACAGDRPDTLGAKNGMLALCPNSPNCVSSQAKEEGQSIAPLPFEGDPDAAFIRLKQLLKKRTDTTLCETGSGYLRVEFRTTFFVDDGEFLIDREHKRIQVRSASRIGYSDLGKNRSRLEEIRRDFAKGGE